MDTEVIIDELEDIRHGLADSGQKFSAEVVGEAIMYIKRHEALAEESEGD